MTVSLMLRKKKFTNTSDVDPDLFGSVDPDPEV